MALSMDAEYIVLSKNEDEEILYFIFESDSIQDLVGVQTLNSHGSYVLFKPSGEGFNMETNDMNSLCKLCGQNTSFIQIADVLHEAQQYHLRDSSYICKQCQKKYKNKIRDLVDQFSKEIATELL